MSCTMFCVHMVALFTLADQYTHMYNIYIYRSTYLATGSDSLESVPEDEFSNP